MPRGTNEAPFHYEYELAERVRTNCGMGRSAMTKFVAIIVGTWLWGAYAMAANGLTTIQSSFGPKETMDRVVSEIKTKGYEGVYAH